MTDGEHQAMAELRAQCWAAWWPRFAAAVAGTMLLGLPLAMALVPISGALRTIWAVVVGWCGGWAVFLGLVGLVLLGCDIRDQRAAARATNACSAAAPVRLPIMLARDGVPVGWIEVYGSEPAALLESCALVPELWQRERGGKYEVTAFTLVERTHVDTRPLMGRANPA